MIDEKKVTTTELDTLSFAVERGQPVDDATVVTTIGQAMIENLINQAFYIKCVLLNSANLVALNGSQERILLVPKDLAPNSVIMVATDNTCHTYRVVNKIKTDSDGQDEQMVVELTDVRPALTEAQKARIKEKRNQGQNIWLYEDLLAEFPMRG